MFLKMLLGWFFVVCRCTVDAKNTRQVQQLVQWDQNSGTNVGMYSPFARRCDSREKYYGTAVRVWWAGDL